MAWLNFDLQHPKHVHKTSCAWVCLHVLLSLIELITHHSFLFCFLAVTLFLPRSLYLLFQYIMMRILHPSFTTAFCLLTWPLLKYRVSGKLSNTLNGRLTHRFHISIIFLDLLFYHLKHCHSIVSEVCGYMVARHKLDPFFSNPAPKFV